MCERHAWGWMVVESAFRGTFMHGPAVLYEDLMGLAYAAFEIRGPMRRGRLRRRIDLKENCLMCEEGFGPHTKGFVKPQIVEQGRDFRNFLSFARKTMLYWRKTVCGQCSGDGSPVRCRRHLVQDESRGLVDGFSGPKALVSYIFHHLVIYARSFQFELQGTQTTEDEAALISAVGWCSGWELFLHIVDSAAEIG